MKIFTCFIILTFTSIAMAETFPPKNWKPMRNPISSPDALPGGQLAIFAGQSPKSLNYYLDNNSFTAEVFGALYETLIDMNPMTLSYEPDLASKWTISADKKTFTFTLDPKARWSDGRTITAHDIKWTYDAILNPKNMTGVHKVSLERFLSPIVLDDQTIQFTAKEVHWVNLGAVGGFHILPKHVFEKKDFNQINFSFPVVSGPYQLDTIKEGRYITLKRRDGWWARKDIRNKGMGNFDILKFMFFADRENAFEAFKKGHIDLFPIYTARIWINETHGKKFEKNWIIRQKIYNHRPVGFQGFAMNMRKPPLDDVRTRKALCMLIDREKMNKTLMYNQYFLHKSYYEDLYDQKHPNPNPGLPFDKKAARKLLHDAGWQVNPSTGLLEKNKQPFVITFLSRSASSHKFLTIYQEDLKDVGISLKIDNKDWAAWAKDMDTFSYQMTWAAWGAGVFKNPEGMWASKEADRSGGNNITGFKHPEVDKLIDEQKQIFDVSKRHAICRKVDQYLINAVPYALLWNINYTRLLYWNKFGVPETVLSKYDDERSAYWYWWFDPDSSAELDDAQKNNLSLPDRPDSIQFDEIVY
ncbi:ABC transporter, substrate-binding protein, family 5 [Candidatus Magnetomorum sp. HK-1]|nr:ABC transporter, substrate-binding protein, family 5 [Candidatus Magnetomorum sp. HK-1]